MSNHSEILHTAKDGYDKKIDRSASKKVEKSEPSNIADGKIKPLWKQFSILSKC
jgi:hypothetical protein